jgi:hypothetical protein
MDSNNQQMFPSELFSIVVKELNEHSKIAGRPFYRFFKDYKASKKIQGFKYEELNKRLDDIDKSQIIILIKKYVKKCLVLILKP